MKVQDQKISNIKFDEDLKTDHITSNMTKYKEHKGYIPIRFGINFI